MDSYHLTLANLTLTKLETKFTAGGAVALSEGYLRPAVACVQSESGSSGLNSSFNLD